MSLIVAWVLFPAVLAALGAGWGAIAERAAGAPLPAGLLLPTGLAAALVVAGTLTAFAPTAPAAVPVVAAGAGAGLLLLPRRLPSPWLVLLVLGVLLAYGAPVLLSGHATFTGFIKLDDTSTWFNIVDHVFSHARSVSGEQPSTYRLVFTGDVGPSYPLGAFMLPGVARAIVGWDIAWVFQPYMACAGAALGLCIYALLGPLVSSTRVRAVLAFVAAQPALLYGYSLWGGIKEMTTAFLLALAVALTAALLPRRPRHWRELVPLAVALGALIQTLGPGGVGWVGPALVILGGFWLYGERRGDRRARAPLGTLAALTALVAAFVVPVWAVMGALVSNQNGFLSGLFSSGQSQATKLGNLIHPLSVFQLAGIWPVGDFRLTAPTLWSTLLIGALLVSACVALYLGIRRRSYTVPLYVLVALSGCAAIYFGGGTPWVTAKGLAISSPALLTAALAGAGLLWSAGGRRRVAGVGGAALSLVLIGGVLWSNVLAYGDATLAPRERMTELEHIGTLVAGAGPTLVNDYEIYADRHFLRAGAPVEPAEYRTATLPLQSGAILTKAAAADLDSFALDTLEPYRSIVTPRSPAESRPPSDYRLVWQGRYYQLWQRPTQPATKILQHIALGESGTLHYCGAAQNGQTEPLCSIDPTATPPCTWLQTLARQAIGEHAQLLVYARPEPIVARGDETLWPGTWYHDPAARTLEPLKPGELISHIAVGTDGAYELWLGGSFTRGFRVSVDGRYLGDVSNELSAINGYAHVANVSLSRGVHTFALEYPGPNLSPGSAENGLTSLSAVALEPRSPRSELIEVSPQRSATLCGRSLDWVELAGPA
jgi:hypothetical protein